MANGDHKLRIFDVITLVLAIGALVVALVHLKELGRAVDRIQKVHDGLSTQYLGEFPAFFPKIVKVVGSAQKNLVIACDFTAYGIFLQQATSEDYFYAIKKKLTLINIETIVMTRTNRPTSH
jgi:hypothetical protein